MQDQSDETADDEIGQAGEQMATIPTISQVVEANDTEQANTSKSSIPHGILAAELPNNRPATSPKKATKVNQVILRDDF